MASIFHYAQTTMTPSKIFFEHGRKCCHSSQVMTDVPTAADLLPAHKRMLVWLHLYGIRDFVWSEVEMLRILSISLLGMMIAGYATGGQSSLAARDTDPESVLNKTWQWVATSTPVGKTTVQNPERYTILLADNGRLQARFDCNRGGGDYKISSGKLSFGPLASTRMACPPDSLDVPFTRDLQRVVSFFIESGKLYLELPVDSGTMCFRPTP